MDFKATCVLLGLLALVAQQSIVQASGSAASCVGTLNPLFSLTQKTCTCRAERTCSRMNATYSIEDKPKLCPRFLEEGSRPITLRIRVQCGSGSGCSLSSVQVWQADPNGRYSAMSGCAKNLTLDSERNEIDVMAPFPGEVVVGPQARQPERHVGFVHVLVRQASGAFISEQFRYPGFNYSSSAESVSKVMRCNASGDDLKSGSMGVVCTLNVSTHCQDETPGSTDKIGKYVEHVQKTLGIPEGADHSHNSPRLSHCPKMKNVAKYYEKASLALVVEVLDLSPEMSNCSVSGKLSQTLTKQSRKLQSTYMASVQHVLKDVLQGTPKSTVKDMLSLKSDGTRQKVVQVQYGRDTECCDELTPGRQYLIMGVSLPLSPDPAVTEGKDLRVFRVWADVVFETSSVLGVLLGKK